MGEDYAKLAGLTDEEDLNETTTKESMKKTIAMADHLVVPWHGGVFRCR